LFIETTGRLSKVEKQPPPPPGDGRSHLSVLGSVVDAAHKLESLLLAIRNRTRQAGIPDKLLKLVDALQFAIETDSDIALASIFFDKHTPKDYPVRHCIDTALLSILVAQAMEKPEEETRIITAAALTMNVSMLALQERLLEKMGRPSAEEDAQIKLHTVVGTELLQQAGVADTQWLSYVLRHHERIDGNGYPHGLSGGDIPEGAQIISLADRYTATISPRSYRRGMLPNIGLRDFLIDRGKTVDATLAGFFIKTLGIYPPGTPVRLQNGEIGVVVNKGPSGTTPAVKVMIDPRGAPLGFPLRRDTDDKRYAIREAVRLKPEDIPFSMQALWGEEASLPVPPKSNHE
jgi:HD-GYP domain-containing protein (c-di-GMP phosphodiesterase class II)